MSNHYDVVIVGGGMVGASLAVGLKDTALKIAVVEQFPLVAGMGETSVAAYQPSYDSRSTAISWGSRLIYERLGVWDALAPYATAIEKIHVSDRGRFGATRLSATDYRVDALGYVVPNEWIGMTLTSALHSQANVDYFCPAKVLEVSRAEQVTHIEISKSAPLANAADTQQKLASEALTADLVVIADGGRSETCQKLGIAMQVEDYGQHALIANVTTSKHHQNEAFERFTENGPMAMLPLGGGDPSECRCALVWTLPEHEVGEVMSLSDSDFMKRLQDGFGYRLGKITAVGERVSYPLKLSQATEQARSGVVVVGNAAHALHPVAGQGYNLALRGVMALAETIDKALSAGKPIGSLSVLMPYMNDRYEDQDKTILFSDKVTRLFGDKSAGAGILRDMGLIGLDILPAAKRLFAKQAMGLGGTEAKLT